MSREPYSRKSSNSAPTQCKYLTRLNLTVISDNAPPDIEKPLRSNNLSDVTSPWYAEFVNLDQEILFELILAANYLDIKPLLELACAKVASLIKNRTIPEIRKFFNIENDFTPEEEAQIMEENKWAEESF